MMYPSARSFAVPVLLGLFVAPQALAEPEVPPVVVEAERLAVAAKAHCDVPRPSPDGRWMTYVVENDTGRRRSVMLYDAAAKRAEAIQPEMEHDDLFGGPGLMAELDQLERSATGGRGGPLVTRVCHEFRWQAGSPHGAYVVACDNEGQHYDLFFSPQADAPPRAISRHPANALLPDVQPVPGSAVVFASSRRSKGDLFVIDHPVPVRDGDAARHLVGKSAAAESSPIWSPRGDRVVYVRADASAEDLYVVAATGSAPKPTRLTRLPGAESEPRWSPDGRRIAFYGAAPAGDRVDLYVIDADGGTPRLIARDVIKSDGAGPAWTPDGEGLVFVAHRDPVNPLMVHWLGTSARHRLDTGTLLNRAPALTQRANGEWWLVWSAQARAGDAHMRWYRIFGARLPGGADDLR